MDAADEHELEHNISHDSHPHACDVRGIAVGGALGRHLVAVDVPPVFGKRSLFTRAPALEVVKPLPSAADDVRHRRVRALAVAVVGARSLYVVVLACVEINQCVGSFLGDDAAVLARSSGEEPAPPRHRAGIASMAWRTTRLQHERAVKF